MGEGGPRPRVGGLCGFGSRWGYWVGEIGGARRCPQTWRCVVFGRRVVCWFCRGRFPERETWPTRQGPLCLSCKSVARQCESAQLGD